MSNILEYRNISKVTFKGGSQTHALKNVSLNVRSGEFLAIVGPSGCGKSTLLNFTVGLTEPGIGEVLCGGKKVTGVNKNVSYMTRRGNLPPWRTVEDNILLPFELSGQTRIPFARRRERVRNQICKEFVAAVVPASARRWVN
jgi:NitT/TauT family transport system ATP-binding protein